MALCHRTAFITEYDVSLKSQNLCLPKLQTSYYFIISLPDMFILSMAFSGAKWHNSGCWESFLLGSYGYVEGVFGGG